MELQSQWSSGCMGQHQTPPMMEDRLISFQGGIAHSRCPPLWFWHYQEHQLQRQHSQSSQLPGSAFWGSELWIHRSFPLMMPWGFPSPIFWHLDVDLGSLGQKLSTLPFPTTSSPLPRESRWCKFHHSPVVGWQKKNTRWIKSTIQFVTLLSYTMSSLNIYCNILTAM